MKKIEIDNKNSHKRNSVIRGHGPHKMLEMQVKEALENSITLCDICSGKIACDSCEEFIFDVFEIDAHTWKGLD